MELDDQLRKLKVYSKFRMREYDNIIVPEIRLAGKWLERLGFKKGADIFISYGSNKLIITVDENKEITNDFLSCTRNQKNQWKIIHSQTIRH